MATRRLRPKKSLGQNFLRNDRIAERIVRSMEPQPGDAILEIGPGEGALTRHLARGPASLVVVEIDRRIAERLRIAFEPLGVTVKVQDILLTDLTELSGELGSQLRIVGNIPYNITTPILFHILAHRHSILDAVLTMQREVARRLVAGAGSKEYGILSVLCQLHADANLLFDVSPGAFFPRPAVMSSVVRLAMLDRPRYMLTDAEFFRSMVRAVFGKRRKMLRSSLAYFLQQPAPGDLGIDLQRRPEDLSIDELAHLSNQLCRHPSIHALPAS